MTKHTGRNEEVRALRADRARVSDLLDRYPRMSEQETDEVRTYLQTARTLDIGRLAADSRLQPKFDAFMSDHRGDFSPSLHPGASIAIAIGSAIAVLGLIEVAFA
jgi:hypothetical protein